MPYFFFGGGGEYLFFLGGGGSGQTRLSQKIWPYTFHYTGWLIEMIIIPT